MSDETSTSNDSRPASAAYVRALEERIADLESKLEALAERHYWLGERLLHLSLATVPEPRFPFWTWYLRRHMSDEVRRRLAVLTGLLTFRLGGEPIPDPLRKDVEGVPHELLNSPEPLTAEDISAAVKAVTGIIHESHVVELFQAMKGQGMNVDLCDFYLANHPPLESPPPPRRQRRRERPDIGARTKRYRQMLSALAFAVLGPDEHGDERDPGHGEQAPGLAVPLEHTARLAGGRAGGGRNTRGCAR